MIKKFGLVSLLFAICNACVQVELASIENTGTITDTMTNSDEMRFVFGVSDLFFYQIDKDFKKKDILGIPDGLVSFPCFSGEALWFQAIEIDDVSNDLAQIGLDCNILQPGINFMTVKVYEDSPVVSTIAKVAKWFGGFNFSFLNSAAENVPAEYRFNLTVTEKCESLNFPSVEEISKLNFKFQQFLGVESVDDMLPPTPEPELSTEKPVASTETTTTAPTKEPTTSETTEKPAETTEAKPTTTTEPVDTIKAAATTETTTTDEAPAEKVVESKAETNTQAVTNSTISIDEQIELKSDAIMNRIAKENSEPQFQMTLEDGE